MSSIMHGTPYHQMAFDSSWQFQNAAYHAAMGVYPYDFTRSPNTSGGSDESMNDSKIDPKNSPKYREKRAKNNEAAKKSRLQRKQRELTHQTENERLKKEVIALQEENKKMRIQIEHFMKTIRDMGMERETYKRQIDAMMMPDAKFNPMALRDLSNNQSDPVYEQKNYEHL